MSAVRKRKPSAADCVEELEIAEALEEGAKADRALVRAVLEKARAWTGLEQSEVAALLHVDDPELLEELFETAREAKEAIYGRRVVLFAPLYISNRCVNECLYCAFRASNRGVARRALDQAEIAEEVRRLVETGHKRLLLVAGEAYPGAGSRYLAESIETIYSTRSGSGEIRRVNVNVAPLGRDGFRQLKACGIGTYQLFQETYHRGTYSVMHPSGPKSDYGGRLEAIDDAMEAGIDDVGLGVLFGLHDHRFEVLALLQHVRHLEARFGVGPHTISVPRIEPAEGSAVATAPPAKVSDLEFKKIVAILRLAVPYTGMILSTREGPAMRTEALALGISQVSAGSRTSPGGYGEERAATEQFQLGDHRPLDEVIRDVARLGYVPSFCTACYRMGRTGHEFMGLARVGAIRRLCLPNALLTLGEYLDDYATEETRAACDAAIEASLDDVSDEGRRSQTRARLERIRKGERDIFF